MCAAKARGAAPARQGAGSIASRRRGFAGGAQPGDEAGIRQQQPRVLDRDVGDAPAQLIGQVEKGIYIIGDGSFSIDQQRYNFQFGGQLFYEIKNGKIEGMLRDVAYQSNTQEFWNSVAGIADKDDYRLGGAFGDGKGQPPQSNAVSHGSATTHFKGVNVINTSRNIG